MTKEFQYTVLCALIGALAAIIAVRATYQPDQESVIPAISTPVLISAPEMQESEQASQSW